MKHIEKIYSLCQYVSIPRNTIIIFLSMFLGFNAPHIINLFVSSEIISSGIDAVVLWVNGTDPKWLERYKAAINGKVLPRLTDFQDRFVEKGELRYCLRSIEANIPWVNKIHLVTDDQVPYWLNTSHPKIHVVSHEDIFGKGKHAYNSMYIQTQLHKIPELSERFILFDDDYFIGKPLEESDFFIGTKAIFRTANPSFMHYSIKDREMFNKNCEVNGFFAFCSSISDAWYVTYLKFGTSFNETWQHVPTPLTKSLCRNVFAEYRYEIYRRMVPEFRSCGQFQMQSLFLNHGLNTGDAIFIHGNANNPGGGWCNDLLAAKRSGNDISRMMKSQAALLCGNSCSKEFFDEVLGTLFPKASFEL